MPLEMHLVFYNVLNSCLIYHVVSTEMSKGCATHFTLRNVNNFIASQTSLIKTYFERFIAFQGDYDLVITDYTRVKSLFGDTEIKVFRKGNLLSFIGCL